MGNSQPPKSPSSVWCPVPWTSVSMNNNGDYRLCVQANTHRETRGVFCDRAGRPLNAAQVSMATARNSELAKEVRASMLSGVAHPVCERCHQEDRLGTKSRRSLEREKFFKNEDFERVLETTTPEGEIETALNPLEDIDIRLGNHCNLSCRSCYPGESSGWYEEWAKTRMHKFSLPNKSEVHLKHLPSGKVVAKNDRSLRWYEESSFFDQFAKDSAGVRHIHIVGGEPLLIGKHFKLLERLIEDGRADEIVLDYNSNLTVIPDRATQLWSQFKEIRMGVSLDGHPVINDFIRHPSRAADVVENMRILNSQLNNLKLWVTSTVMIYNIFYIPELVDYLVDNEVIGIDSPMDLRKLTFHKLNNPIYLNPSILPDDVKSRVNGKYRAWIRGKNDWSQDFVAAVERHLEVPLRMMDGKENPSELRAFEYKNRIMDRFRDQSFESACSEFAGLLNNSSCMRSLTPTT